MKLRSARNAGIVREDSRGRGITELQLSNRCTHRILIVESAPRTRDGEWRYFSPPFAPETEQKAHNVPLSSIKLW